MLMLISPAKSLDFENPAPVSKTTRPRFKDEANYLASVLKTKSPDELQSLMNISSQLAELNHERYQLWLDKPVPKRSKQALPAFTGEVFRGIDASSFSAADFDFAQKHLRILSGLYGVLRPLDSIQPYRLEMGTKMQVDEHKNLYEFWGDDLTESINKELKKKDVIVNLASNEYFKSLNKKALKAPVITPVFKDYNKGSLKVVTVYAKNARGQMVRYITKNRITDIEQIKHFDVNGYAYDDNLSDDKRWVFVR